jgi:hypothetical protein
VIFPHLKAILWNTTKAPKVDPMPAAASLLSDLILKRIKHTSEDYVLTDVDGLQLHARSSGSLLGNCTNLRLAIKDMNKSFRTSPYPLYAHPFLLIY